MSNKKNNIYFDLLDLVRRNIRQLKPYRSARDDYDSGILLDANENSLGSPFGTEDGLNRYPSPHQNELRARIADYRSVEKENMFVGVGSDEAIDLLMRIFCRPGKDRILIAPPTYGMYKVSAQIHDVGVDEVLLTPKYQLQPEKMLEKVRDTTKLMFLCSPNNPTGNDLTLKDINYLINHFDGIVVVDEAYIDFSKQKSLAPMVREYPNLVVTQTFSKAFGLAGIRLGTAIASKAIIKLLSKVKAPYNINRLTSQYALEAFDHLDRIQQNIEKICDERDRLRKKLQEIEAVNQIMESDANFILFKVNQAYEVHKTLAEQGIIVRYRGNQPLCQNSLRVSVGTPEENDKFLEALKQITRGTGITI
jgi:histidinol-phosphate aminotransferase